MEIGLEGEGDRNISGQPDGSKKRKSLSKTQFQEEMLEKTYAEETYPSRVTRAKLLQTLQLTNRQLENWFYKRRLKDNKQRTPKRVAGDDEVTESLKPSKQDLTVAEGGGGCESRHDSRKMENGVLKFKVGQLAETKTFEKGFRAAWFRCKIMDINLKNKILPEYYDFLPEEIKWGKIYATPPYGKKSKRTKKQLMVRPQYPEMYHKSEMPAGDSISEVCVVIDGAWKVGDLVDWYKDDCFWSATVTKILSDDKVQIELPEPPAGQGEVYEASCKDLRPSLDWSPRKGWTLPTLKGPTSCKTQLIFPSLQGTDLEREEVASTSRMSVISLTDPMDESPESQQVKMDGDVVENASSSDSISTLQVEESKTNDDTWKDFDYNIIDLNIMHEETLEASILDLEELANRIKWLRSIVNNNQSSGSSWKFGERSSIAQV